MNKARRKQLETIAINLDQAIEDLRGVVEEEEEYYENMPDPIQAGSKGDVAAETIGELEDLVSSLEDSRFAIDEVMMR